LVPPAEDRLVALACRSGAGALLMPCGPVPPAAGGSTAVRACWSTRPAGVLPMTGVLPDAFGPDDLPA
jgi:cytidine deaminase